MSRTKISLTLSMALYGSIGLFVRNISFSSGQIALARGVLGCLFLLVVSVLTKRRMSFQRIKPNLYILLASGAALGVNWILLFEAYRYTTVSNATICYYFAPVFILLLSPVVLKERLGLFKVLCMVAAVVGMIFIMGTKGGGSAQNHSLGVTYGLLAAALYAGIVFMNKFMKGMDNMEVSIVQLLVSAIALTPYVLRTDGTIPNKADATSIALLLVLGVLHTGVAYYVYFNAIHKLKSQTVAMYSYIDPISAILFSHIILGESISSMQITGGVLILGATFVNEARGVWFSKKSEKVTQGE